MGMPKVPAWLLPSGSLNSLWKTGLSGVVHGNHYAISKTREPGVGAARRLVGA